MVTGEQLRAVHCKADRLRFAGQRLGQGHLQVVIAEVKLNEIQLQTLGQALVVVITHWDAKGAAEAITRLTRRGLAEVGFKEQIPGLKIALGEATDQLIDAVGLQALAGAFDSDHLAANGRALGERLGDHHALGQILAVDQFALSQLALTGLSHGFLHRADLAHHFGEFLRQQADLVVVAFHVAIDGDVLFDDPGPQCHRRYRDGNAALMP